MTDLPFGSLVNAAGGFVFIALGAWVLTLRPKRPATRDFGLYAMAFGVTFTAQNLVGPGVPEGWVVAMFLISAVAAVPAGWALLRLATHFPEPLAPGERRLLAIPVAAGLAHLVVLSLGFLVAMPRYLDFDGNPVNAPSILAVIFALNATIGWLLATAVGVAALFALRSLRAARGEGALRRQYAFLAGVLSLFPAFYYGTWLVGEQVLFRLVGAYSAAVLVAVAALWLWASARTPDPRPARNVALVALGLLALGMAASTLVGGFLATDATGAYGVVRMAEVLLLAFAILRLQLLGLDVKVRWTIQKSTVAAAFIGVFFVASEGAQTLFAAQAGSEWAGIAAAGALVFAMAPLQRAAERVASAAIPATEPKGGSGLSEGEPLAFYRAQLDLAWADGRISAKERLLLRNLRERLGLDVAEAERAEAEVMGQAAARVAARRPRRVGP